MKSQPASPVGIIQQLKDIAYYMLVGGLVVTFLPFSFLESFRMLGKTVLQIGIVGMVLLEVFPRAWKSGAIHKGARKLSALLWEIFKKMMKSLYSLARKNNRSKGDEYLQSNLAEQTEQAEVDMSIWRIMKESIPGTDRKINSAQSVDSIQPPFSYFPLNPKGVKPASFLKEEMAETIREALDLADLLPKKGERVTSLDVLSVESGPVLQTISFRIPRGIQLSQLIKKRDDLANHMGFLEGFDVISGKEKSSAAFVIPQKERSLVYARDGMVNQRFLEFCKTAKLPIYLGTDSVGNPLFFDLAKAPHLLAAGATGSGKSVFINLVLTELLTLRTPDQVQLLLIDPKMVELGRYNGFPHLLSPVVTDMRRASVAMKKVVVEMERRYEMLAKAEVTNIEEYNLQAACPLSYIVVVVDEYADLMMVSPGEMEDAVQRITQKARAAGIHLILATQRPSVDVVTGVIKANLPSRIAFRMQSQIDYRTVLDTNSPDLLGNGDGTMILNGGALTRFQSATLSIDVDEVKQLLKQLKGYWKNYGVDSLTSSDFWVDEADESKDNFDQQEGECQILEQQEEDSLYNQATELVIKEQVASASFLQRRLRVGYTRAASLIDRMEQDGIVSKYIGEAPREVLIKSLAEIKVVEENLELKNETIIIPEDQPIDQGGKGILENDPTDWIARRLNLPSTDLLVRVAVTIKEKGLVIPQIIVEEIPGLSIQKAQIMIRQLEDIGMIEDHPSLGKRIRWINEHLDVPDRPKLTQKHYY
ncbi:FtsK/SpoIIIE domain-containing protein [Brevibacillus sp. SYSU BS000544]|uniref:FtsK/SpoIIIE domain-containing protein n=1 Tax=Brevibacillus sp. SYSU BS000544 TaxID=3416443 RepID=UPI003CE5B5F3